MSYEVLTLCILAVIATPLVTGALWLAAERRLALPAVLSAGVNLAIAVTLAY